MAYGTRVALDCIGCKLNQAEIESLSRQFTQAGYQVVLPSAEADIYVLNTCTVTHVADRKSRQLLRRAYHRNPEACIVAMGCLAQRAPEELAGIKEVRLVVSNTEKSSLLDLLGGAPCPEAGSHRAESGGGAAGRRARTFLKIQDGCANRCAYCVVPLVRCGESSVPAKQVIDEVNRRVAEGYWEVVLTGTKVGAYHDGTVDLATLLKRVLGTTGVPRLRLSSLQPYEITEELIGLWQDKRLCPHFHLSLQSGSDAVLHRMKRRYTRGEFARTVNLLREIIPDVAITTDIIAGFPGETEAEFADSYHFCRRTGFARIHVFPYSSRPGTEAAGMTGMVSACLKKEREQQLLVLAAESARNYMRQFKGRILPVLWEKETAGVWSGLTGNYLRIFTRSSSDLSNQLLPARFTEVNGDGVWGELIP
ncbi:tRNA (N(6)-L-threonylcarbamoyladenosine(37)-C(2))-methylthiotransferase MtaB [Chloroflexota bacterium]